MAGSTVVRGIDGINKKGNHFGRFDLRCSAAKSRVRPGGSQLADFMMHSKSLRILINDTRGMMARRTALERHGHKVTVAPSVQEGLDQLTSQTFDLVVTVYRMADSSEQQVIEKIRQHDPQILIVVLSGYVEILGLTEQSC